MVNKRKLVNNLHKILKQMIGWIKFILWVLLTWNICSCSVVTSPLPGAVGALKLVICFIFTIPFFLSLQDVEFEMDESERY